MSSDIKLLFVDDEKRIRDLFVEGMKDQALQIETAANGREALEKLKGFPADIVITDVRMPVMDGLRVLREIKRRFPGIFVIVLTGYGSSDDAVIAMKAGAYDYILKPFRFDRIRELVDTIREQKNVWQQTDRPAGERRKRYRLDNIVGQDPKLFRIFQMIDDVAKTNATVLLTGETGTGKELIAEAIHYKSSRKAHPLIKVNCAAFTETLINSELFGHEKGAFTGATALKKGYFELADKGTIFLDEIGDIPLATQISLLRVLETGTFQRVGGTRTVKVDTRVICATNKDLFEAVKSKLFREDLFYRIKVVSIHVPPLRERKSDIPLLVHHFLKRYSAEMKREAPRVSRKAMNMLIRHDWPGNVRELANLIENALIFCKGKELTEANLPAELADSRGRKSFALRLSSWSLPEAESTLILKVLEETGWNLKRAAAELDIARGTLYSKLHRYGIKRP